MVQKVSTWEGVNQELVPYLNRLSFFNMMMKIGKITVKLVFSGHPKGNCFFKNSRQVDVS